MKKRFNKKNVMIAILILFSISLLISGGLFYKRFVNKQTLYFGVGGPFTGEHDYYGREMIRGIDLCLDQVNRNGGIDGKTLKYISGDDMDIPSFAVKVASDFDRKNILFVLGHYSSQASFSAGQIYMKKGIPAVTASASADIITQKNEWYFRTTPSDLYQAYLLLSFMINHLNLQSATIIYTKDILGRSFKDAFTQAVSKADFKIKKMFEIDTETSKQDQIFKICKNIKKSGANNVICLATSADIAAQIIVKLKLMNITATIVGPDTLSNKALSHAMKDKPLEKAIPGYYTDGIMITASDIFGNHLLNDASVHFYRNYYNRYKMFPSPVAAGYYDATLTMVEVLRQIELDEDATITQCRRLIRRFLVDINKPDYAINGICGDIFFDNKGNAIKSTGLGQYHKGQLTPYHQQFVLKKNSDIETSYLFKMPYQELSIVNVKTKICDLDFKENKFIAHCLLTFIYKNNTIDISSRMMNTSSHVRLGQPIEEYTTDGFIHQTYNIQATFKKDVNDFLYPFDHQKLTITFQYSSSNDQEIRFFNQEPPEYHLNNFIVSGWTLGDIYSYGSTDRENNEPSFNIVVNISRDYMDILIKILVPGVVIVFLLLSIYIICPSICFIAVIILLTCLGLNTFLYMNLKEVQVYYTPYDHWFIFLYMMLSISLMMVLLMSFFKRIGRLKSIIGVKLLGCILHLGCLGYLYYSLKNVFDALRGII